MGFFFFFLLFPGVGESIWLSPAPLPPHAGPGDAEAGTDPCTPPPSPGLMEGERSPPARGTPRPPAVEWAALIYRRGSLSTRPRHTQIPRNPAPELGGGHGPWGALGPPLPPPPPGDPDSEVKMPALFLAGSEKKKNSPSPASHGPPLPRGTGVGHPRAGESAEPEIGGGGILSTPPGHGLPPPPPRAVPLGWGGWCWFSLYFAIRPGPFPAGPFAGVFQRGKLKG